MSIIPASQFSVFLESLHEPEDNALLLKIAEAKEIAAEKHDLIIGSHTLSDLTPIRVTPDSRRFQLFWESYVAYSVRNESFALADKNDPEFRGVFVERSTSTYLRFIEETTFATSVFQKPMRHWQVNCQNHCIDVVSFDEPSVEEVRDQS
jgi:hypothetical protein